MSFILDALRKSENERQRNTTPGIADAPVRQPPSRRALWIPLVAVLLGVNLSLLVVLWYMGDKQADTQATAESISNRDPLPAPAPALELPIADPTVSRELSDELDPAPERADTAPREQTPSQPRAATNNPVLDVPTLAELTLTGSVSLPPLHLDIHVYSQSAAERFVFINTTKYREGDQISEGPIVDEINQLGVVLTHQNRRFLLTRD